MFFKKELQSVSSQKELDRIKKMLDGAGIKYSVSDKGGVQRGGDAIETRHAKLL